ncbi:MAG: SMP-30/gluconolactonase/LRE family protein [Burkholderiales bacterium]
MKRLLTGLACLLFIALGGGPAWADSDRDRDDASDRDAAKLFVTLPEGVRYPEGITANPANGDIFVSTFDAPSPTNPDPRNKLLRFNRHGKLEAVRDFGTDPLLGLEFDRVHNKVYITNVGDFSGTGSRIQRIAANFNSSTVPEFVADIPSIGAPDDRIVGNPDTSEDKIQFGDFARVPNALAFDRHGNLYVSDSFQGAIFMIESPRACGTAPKPACKIQSLVHDPLLATAGFPPFGANGLAFDTDESVLFVANTGDDRILKVNMASKKVSEFAQSINGADGIAFDRHGLLWVCANQNDEVVALNQNGRVVRRMGDFQGIRRDGSPRGLLFPASVVIVGDELFVTNLALPLTPTVGDETEEGVTRFTVSRIKLPHH